jgi:hypothetical protein
MRMTASVVRRLVALLAVFATMALAAGRGEAHKPITSPYTYNADVFPILRDHCGTCHVAGGVAPMSLMTYQDAFPWGESIRTELVAGHMPPWTVEAGSGTFRNAHVLSARDLNVLLTWVTGGNPVGDVDRPPPPVILASTWRMGPPDLVLQLPAEFTVGADTIEETREFTLRVPTTDARPVRFVDLLPGNPAIVRSATIALKKASATAENTLAMWVPGDTPVPLEAGTAFELPAGSELLVRIHYKKTWSHEREAMNDRSSVGIYFAAGAAKELRAVSLAATEASPLASEESPSASDASRPAGSRVSFVQPIADDLQAVAIYPDAALVNARVDVSARRPDGTIANLIRFRPQPDWVRRYWFTKPIALPRGSRITVAATFDDPLLPPGAAPLVTKPPDPSAVRLTLNVLPGP